MEQPTRSGSSFAWGKVGIGAAAMLGFVRHGGGLVAWAYFGRRISVRPRSAS